MNALEQHKFGLANALRELALRLQSGQATIHYPEFCAVCDQFQDPAQMHAHTAEIIITSLELWNFDGLPGLHRIGISYIRESHDRYKQMQNSEALEQHKFDLANATADAMARQRDRALAEVEQLRKRVLELEDSLSKSTLPPRGGLSYNECVN